MDKVAIVATIVFTKCRKLTIVSKFPIMIRIVRVPRYYKFEFIELSVEFG
eukprot:SAG31_NODE_1340_length_8709_cov_8.259117_8_plen_50_part_00